ncbi:hypothetical protein [Thalassotalea agarivorans]|uniref:Uncharacterized protein n=1 Tax=Thalassotalea agarivorans TaxID=349064 RepID=A0A1I0FMZ3_THASX|nr:hypothetical protein [Thalassotalea agarivorans]SET58932.1 hypothetical protein SAMN05660429_02183 [Thalassotalea agarivorans]
MKELSKSQLTEVNGGVVALYWVVKGGIAAYRTYKSVRFVSQAIAGGVVYDVAKSVVD